MRPSHSGILGNPITPSQLTSALTAPGSTRSSPPHAAKKNYNLLGRTDPLSLGTADLAAFSKLDTMLAEVKEPPPSVSSSAAASRPLSASGGGTGRIKGVVDNGGNHQVNGSVEHFPPAPGPRAGLQTLSPARPQTRTRRQQQQQQRNKSRPGDSFVAVYNQQTPPRSGTFGGGAQHGQKAARAAAPPDPPEEYRGPGLNRPRAVDDERRNRLRSPETLLSFGAKFAGGRDHGSFGRPGTHSGLRRTASSSGTLRSDTSFISAGGVSSQDRQPLPSPAFASSTRGSLHSRGSLSRSTSRGGLRPPNGEWGPLLSSVPKPLLAENGVSPYEPVLDSSTLFSNSLSGASYAGREMTQRQYSAFRAAEASTQSTLRLLVAQMMLGLQEQHVHSLASFATPGAGGAESSEGDQGR
jgi:hypothetical protein